MTDQEIAQNYANKLEDALRETKPEANFTWKRMFGGAGYYVDEQIFAAWYGRDVLALKLPTADADELKKLGGIAAPETMSKQYTYLPEAIQNDEKAFAAWVAKSIAYVSNLPKKKKKKA
jgi:TfoX/Sxy family transcriptional regulator of competence genes